MPTWPDWLPTWLTPGRSEPDQQPSNDNPPTGAPTYYYERGAQDYPPAKDRADEAAGISRASDRADSDRAAGERAQAEYDLAMVRELRGAPDLQPADRAAIDRAERDLSERLGIQFTERADESAYARHLELLDDDNPAGRQMGQQFVDDADRAQARDEEEEAGPWASGYDDDDGAFTGSVRDTGLTDEQYAVHDDGEAPHQLQGRTQDEAHHYLPDERAVNDWLWGALQQDADQRADDADLTRGEAVQDARDAEQRTLDELAAGDRDAIDSLPDDDTRELGAVRSGTGYYNELPEQRDAAGDPVQDAPARTGPATRDEVQGWLDSIPRDTSDDDPPPPAPPAPDTRDDVRED